MLNILGNDQVDVCNAVSSVESISLVQEGGPNVIDNILSRAEQIPRGSAGFCDLKYALKHGA